MSRDNQASQDKFREAAKMRQRADDLEREAKGEASRPARRTVSRTMGSS